MLQTVAEQGAIDPAVVGTIDEWNRKYESVLAAGPALQRPAYAGTGAISTAPAPVLPGGACSEADTLMAIFLALLRRAGAPQWWHQYRGIAPEWLDLYLSLESGALALTHARRARLLAYKLVDAQVRGDLSPASAAAYRIAVTTLDQEVGEVLMEIIGSWALGTSDRSRIFERAVEDHWRYAQASTVASGTLEMQKQLLAKSLAS